MYAEHYPGAHFITFPTVKAGKVMVIRQGEIAKFTQSDDDPNHTMIREVDGSHFTTTMDIGEVRRLVLHAAF